MQVDTEMNLALEHGETVKRMRKAIWWLNTKSKDAVPDAMHLNSVAKKPLMLGRIYLKRIVRGKN